MTEEIIKSLWKELYEIHKKANWAFENYSNLDEISQKQLELIAHETENINFKLNVLRKGGKVDEDNNMSISIKMEGVE